MSVTDDLNYVAELAFEIGSDGVEPVEEDVIEVLNYFGLPRTLELSSMVREGLASAAEFYKITQDFGYDPQVAFAEHVDEGTYSSAAAASWRQEFSERALSECKTLVERLKRFESAL